MKKSYSLLILVLSLNVCSAKKPSHNIEAAPHQNYFYFKKVQPTEKENKKMVPLEKNIDASKKKKYVLRNPDSIRIIPKESTFSAEKDEHDEYTGYYKVGAPYEVNGITYYPEKSNDYEESGQASWYGLDFDGKKTANGETYDMQDFTAAHRTLPLPSMVRVTNLTNGKSATVRVNDRGPFANDRIIDVSKSAADQLGFQDKGFAHVKIKFLKKETAILLDKINKDKNKKNDK